MLNIEITNEDSYNILHIPNEIDIIISHSNEYKKGFLEGRKDAMNEIQMIVKNLKGFENEIN